MTFSALDSERLGPPFATGATRARFSDEVWLRADASSRGGTRASRARGRAVRDMGDSLGDVLERVPEVHEAAGDVDLAGAFDLAPAAAAADPWMDCALSDAARVRARLSSKG